MNTKQQQAKMDKMYNYIQQFRSAIGKTIKNTTAKERRQLIKLCIQKDNELAELWEPTKSKGKLINIHIKSYGSIWNETAEIIRANIAIQKIIERINKRTKKK